LIGSARLSIALHSLKSRAEKYRTLFGAHRSDHPAAKAELLSRSCWIRCRSFPQIKKCSAAFPPHKKGIILSAGIESCGYFQRAENTSENSWKIELSSPERLGWRRRGPRTSTIRKPSDILPEPANELENCPRHIRKDRRGGMIMGGNAILESVRRYRAIASLYRQTAAFRPLQRHSLLGQAARWEQLAISELEAYFSGCDGANQGQRPWGAMPIAA
jgi:hypothetical protein